MNVSKYSPIFFSPDEPGGSAAAAPAPDAPAEVGVGGQGEATGSGLYSLDAFPEAIRGQVEPIFKEWDANVTREFQKRAETWAPYEELGIKDINPEDLGQLLGFYEIASDEDAFKNWVSNAFEALGLGGEPQGEPADLEAGEGEGDKPLTAADVEALLEQREQARQQETEQQRLHDEIASEVKSTFEELGVKDEQDQEIIAFLAQRLDDPQNPRSVGDLLKSAHQEWAKKLGKVESDALDQKLKQPTPAENGGRPHSAPKPASSFEEAGARLRERLQNARQAA